MLWKETDTISELISEILQWNPAHEHASYGLQQEPTYDNSIRTKDVV